MADCINGIFGVVNYNLTAKSGIYSTIAAEAAVQDAETSVPTFFRPEIPTFDFGAPIGETAAARLQEAIAPSEGSPPTATFEPPALQRVAHEALSSLVNFQHNSPTISGVPYIDGLSNVPVPSITPSNPPLDYPQNAVVPDEGVAGYEHVVAPTLSVGSKPQLINMRPEAYVSPDLSPLLFDPLSAVAFPDVEELDWQDPLEYEEDEAFRGKLRALMDGNDEIVQWVASAVQTTLYHSNIRGLDRRTKRQLDEVMDRAGSRNFELPHGAVDALVLQIAGDELEESYRAAEQVREEVYEAAITALTAAIRQALSVERYHFRLYMRYLRQNLRVRQLNLEMAQQMLRAYVEVYQLFDRHVRIQVDAYNQYVRAATATNRAAVSQLEFAELASLTYQARVQMYEADVRLQQQSARIQRNDVRFQSLALAEYEATLRGKLADLQTIEQNLEAFGAAIEAHNERARWFDSAIAAQEAHIDAGIAKVGVDEAKFDAYARLWAGEGDRQVAYQQYLQASTRAMDSLLRDYREAAQSEARYFAEVAQALGLSQQAVGQYASLVAETARAADAFNAADISYVAASNDVAVAQGARDMAQDAILAEAAAQYARLDASNEAAKVTAAGALSQSASAIFQVGLSAAGGSSHRVTGRDAGSSRASVSDRKTFSKECLYVENPTTT